MSSSDQVQVSSSSLESLEFADVLSLVAALASTDLGRARVLALGPVRGEELARRRGAIEELAGLLDEGLVVRSLDETISELSAELAGSRPELGGPKLKRWERVLATAREAIEHVGRKRPHLHTIVRDLDDLGWLEESISSTLDARGGVRDEASPALSKLRRRIGKVRSATYEHLHGVLWAHGDSFSEDTTPFHNGRLVLMMRSGDRGRVEGLVHGRSASGRSLYFEPMAAVESNNALQEAVAEEEAERRRLLRELGEQLVANREAIEATLAALAELDLLQAAWRFGELVEGRLVEISSGDLVLLGARHPMLAAETAELRRAVFGAAGHVGGATPLDLELIGEQRALVVTGPNAGGKTVALKTVGLIVLMTLCGLPVPVAAGSRVPEVGAIVGVVGDEQDLMQDRSTFSGRLLRLQEAWQAAGPETLVLLDELGSGTDPEEGAALSIALLEHLVGQGTGAIVTTHLVAVASAAAEISGAVSASMEFDRETHSPTFRLIPGPPGGSEAIALARQLELPEPWLERAESLVGEEHGRLQSLLADVERLRGGLEVEAESLRRLRQEAAAERQAVAAKRRSLEEERRQLGMKMKRDLAAFRRRVRERMSEEVARLKGELAAGRRRQLAPQAVERLFESAPKIPRPADESTAPIGIGDEVCHVEYSWTGRVEKIDGQRASVSVRGKRLECALEQLRPAAARPGPRQAPRVEISHGEGEVPLELELIGQRVDEALESLDRYLDRALLVPHAQVRIIHGHGSGRLRKAVRRFLDDHPGVEHCRPGRDHEGGDGATVVRLET